MDIAGALTRKIGPLPGWAWGGLAAVGVWFFFLRGKPSAAATPNAAAAGSQLASGYGLGYAQGLQSAGPPSGAASTTTPAASPGRRGHTVPAPPGFPSAGYGAIPIYDSPQMQNIVGWAPFDQDLTVTGPAVNGRKLPSGQSAWYPIDWGGTPGFVSGDSFASFAQSAVGGIGGGRPAGSRSAHLMHHAHPLVGARVPYQFHVRAVGGPMNHANEVHRVALQSGVHPARIMALNPTPTGFIRVA